MRVRALFVLLLVLAGGGLWARGGAQTAGPPLAVRVAVNRPGAAIPSTLFGIFFEDINFAADGGLYPERVKNRSFEFPDPLMGWQRATVEAARGRFAASTDSPPAPPTRTTCASRRRPGSYRRHQRRLPRHRHPQGRALHRSPARAPRGRRAGVAPCRVRERRASRPQGGATIDGLTPRVEDATRAPSRPKRPIRTPSCACWRRPGRDRHGHGLGVSRRHVGGPRERPARGSGPAAKDMHPGFLRFPGGCIVEGRFLEAAISGRRRLATRPSAS